MIALEILKKTDSETLAKAATCLMDNGYSVSVSLVHERYITGRVHGGTETYEVMLAEHRVHCTCPDSQFRKSICKHATLFALSLIRATQIEEQTVASESHELMVAAA